MNGNFYTNLNEEINNCTENQGSCVGWFKLAELITRKEKEKALSLYRLLSHSFDDRAYALQLEGDILWSLDDREALQKYEQAAYLYKKEQKNVAAVAVYEHLLLLESNNYDFLSTLLTLYILLSWPEKFEKNYSDLLQKHKDGIFTQDQVFNFSKKIIDSVLNHDSQKRNYFDQDENFLPVDLEVENFMWVLDSFAKVLKQDFYKDLRQRVKNYCLEFDFNLNT